MFCAKLIELRRELETALLGRQAMRQLRLHALFGSDGGAYSRLSTKGSTRVRAYSIDELVLEERVVGVKKILMEDGKRAEQNVIERVRMDDVVREMSTVLICAKVRW